MSAPQPDLDEVEGPLGAVEDVLMGLSKLTISTEGNDGENY